MVTAEMIRFYFSYNYWAYYGFELFFGRTGQKSTKVKREHETNVLKWWDDSFYPQSSPFL